MKLIDRILAEFLEFGPKPDDIDEADSPAAQQAAQMGLVHIGGGNYGPGNELVPRATHRSVDGGARLVPVKQQEPSKQKVAKKDKEKKKPSSKKPKQINKEPPEIDRESFPEEIRKDINMAVQKVTKNNGQEMAAQFFEEFQSALQSLNAGDTILVGEFLAKWKIFSERRARGTVIYSALIDDNGVAFGGGRRPTSTTGTPFGKGRHLTNNLIRLLGEKGIELPDISGVGDEKPRFTPVHGLFPSQVFGDVRTDARFEIERDHNGVTKKIKMGNIKMSAVDLGKHKDKSEEIQQMLGIYNSQIELMGKLWDKNSDKFKGTFLPAGSTKLITEKLTTSISNVNGVSEERINKINGLIHEMSQISEKSEDELFETFNVLEKELLTEVNSTNDPITASRAYLAESLSILRESLRGSDLIIPEASDFTVGDLISIVPRSKLPGVVDVSLEFESIKYGSGAGSSQRNKIALTAYASSKYGTANEIKDLLTNLTSVEDGSLYNKLFNGNEQDVKKSEAEVNELIKKFEPLIKKYYKTDDIEGIIQNWENGKTPVLNKQGEVVIKPPISILKDGHKDNIRCKDNVPSLKTYGKMAYLVDVINNTHMLRQGFRNHSHSHTKGVTETTGGFQHGNRRSVGTSKANLAKGFDNCKPIAAFASKIVHTPYIDLKRP